MVHVARSTEIAFDAYEFLFDPVTGNMKPTDGLYGTDCGKGSSRALHNGGLPAGFTYNDMRTVPGLDGGRADRVGVCWYEGKDSVNLALLLVTTENWVQLTRGNPNTDRQDIDGIVAEFGPIAAKTGYYLGDIDLASVGLGIDLPSSRNGGYMLAFGDYDPVTQTFALGYGKPLNWGRKAGNPCAPEQRPYWSDENPVDGQFTSDEYISYSTNCPDPQGPMLALLYDPASPRDEIVRPTSQRVEFGKVTSGSFSSLLEVDGAIERVCRFVVPSRSGVFARIELDFHPVSTDVGPMKLVAFAAGSQAGNCYLALELWKPGVGYVTVREPRFLYTDLQAVTGEVVDGTSFIDGSRNVRARLVASRLGNTVQTPCVSLDGVLLRIKKE